MGANGRNKGKAYELYIARLISVWWTGNKALENARAEDLPFRRTPNSGAWDKHEAAADILVTRPEMLKFPFVFSCEMKCSEAWDWNGYHRYLPGWIVSKYWEQCREAAANSKKIPLLIFSKNREPDFFCLRKYHAARWKVRHVSFPADHDTLAFGLFSDLTAIPPQQIVEHKGA